jgi:L-asparaginase
MKKTKRNRILLLFAGGTSLVTQDGAILEIRSKKDAGRWMRGVPELNLIAAVEPVFLTATMDAVSQPQWWATIAKTIAKRYGEFDGFIVTNDPDTIAYTAAALTLMLKGIGKPVVVTGTFPVSKVSSRTRRSAKPWTSDQRSDSRANLINAAQVATLDLGEVVVVHGSRLLRGACVVRQSSPSAHLLESVGVPPIGRVDFGLKLEPHRRKRAAGSVTLATAMKTRILQLFLLPSSVEPMVPRIPDGTLDGVFLSGQMLSSSPGALNRILDEAEARRIPVCLYSPWPGVRTTRFLTIHGVTPPMALVKFMWALGQARSHGALQRLLANDIAGETIPAEGTMP